MNSEQSSACCSHLQLANVRVQLNELREELDQCVSKQDFTRAAQIKTSISDLDSIKNSLLSASEQTLTQEVRVEKVNKHHVIPLSNHGSVAVFVYLF